MTSNLKVGHLLDEVTEGIIVQQVNAQGVMASGIAKAIREKWPKVWDVYSQQIKPKQPDKGLGWLGSVIYVQVAPELWVANIVGQQFYGRDPDVQYTSYEALDMGFYSIANFAKHLSTSFEKPIEVHYPTIGCGLGGGNWTIVSQLIDVRLDTITHTLWRQPE